MGWFSWLIWWRIDSFPIGQWRAKRGQRSMGGARPNPDWPKRAFPGGVVRVIVREDIVRLGYWCFFVLGGDVMREASESGLGVGGHKIMVGFGKKG